MENAPEISPEETKPKMTVEAIADISAQAMLYEHAINQCQDSLVDALAKTFQSLANLDPDMAVDALDQLWSQRDSIIQMRDARELKKASIVKQITEQETAK